MTDRPSWGPAGEVARLVEKIRPVLSGHPPELQGAVLADLTAMWLAGHVHVDDHELTAKLRESLLDLHTAAVRELIPVNAKAMGTDGRGEQLRSTIGAP